MEFIETEIMIMVIIMLLLVISNEHRDGLCCRTLMKFNNGDHEDNGNNGFVISYDHQDRWTGRFHEDKWHE